jgi:hypothetical protein
MDAKTITLSSFADGAAEELFQDALRQVLRNVEDPNTDHKTRRAIGLTFVFSCDEERRVDQIETKVSTKLAGRSPSTSRESFRKARSSWPNGRTKGEPMPIDLKFRFLAVCTEHNHVHTHDDGLVFLAHDKALVPTLRFYRAECERLGAGEAQLRGIDLLIGRVEDWQVERPDLVKVADLDDTPIGRAIAGED